MSIKSDIINNPLITQYTGVLGIIKFKNEKHIESYEQTMCGGKDNNTWGSWVSCKEKFNFPCWILCNYVKHDNDDSYTALYFTPEEVKKDLTNFLEKINNIIK